MVALACVLAGCGQGPGAVPAETVTVTAPATPTATATPTPTGTPGTTGTPAPAATTTSLRGSAGSFTWDVRVPRFPGRPAEVDRRVRTSAQHAVDEARASVRAGDAPRRLEGTGTVTTDDGRTVQVRYGLTDFTEGTAHPTGSVRTVALRADDGSPITLGELFQDEGSALSTLAMEVERLAGERGEDVEAAGLAPDPENWGAWQTTPEGMAVSFQDFQLGGHGVREYTVSWDVLEELVTPEAYDLLGPA
ncbi:hypothetical protein NUM3379_33330 [Kineococcus sp. NUM-3379]